MENYLKSTGGQDRNSNESVMAMTPQKMVEPMSVLARCLKDYQEVDIFQSKRSIGRPRKYLCTNHVKKDALWKPLLRKFRRFIKEYVSG